MTPTTTIAARRVFATAAALCAAVLATACGTATNPGGGDSASPPVAPTSSAPAPTPSPSVAVACATSALKADVNTAKSGGAAGSIYYPIDFANTSASACTLYGYPGVSFVTGRGGGQIGDPASRNTSIAPTTVTLAPGGVAHATIQVAEAGNYNPSQCQPVTARWLKIYPPGQVDALYVPFTTQACSAKLATNLGAQLSVYVVRPGAGGNGP